jgi:transposase-like protein
MLNEVNYYSDEFKKTVVNEVLSGRMCKEEARRWYGIKGKSSILYWIRKFAPSQITEMKKLKQKVQNPSIELEAENKRLREELNLERLRTLSLNVMIDIAEEEFKIPIRKKSGAKRSKK